MKVLVLTTLYPSAADPLHGVFVENRLRHLVASGEVEARVVAPVPWFPLRAGVFGRYATFARTPRAEERHGLPVLHPRYLVLPRVGWTSVPGRLARAGLRAARALQREGFDCDLIDAHYFFPDGVAAAHVARILDKPLVVTARGTDLNVIARQPRAREQVREACRTAGGLVAVSRPLASRLEELGAEPGRIRVLGNGVDGAVFHPAADRDALRAELGVDGPLVLSVGRLVAMKGHALLVRALTRLGGTRLALVGDGPEREALGALAREVGVEDRVRFLGRLPQEEVARWHAAADVVALASDNEGCPNALLEALASGTPVVASAVGGVPDIVADPVAGRLVARREPAAFAEALELVLARPRDEAGVVEYARRFSWEATTAGQLELFRSLARS